MPHRTHALRALEGLLRREELARARGTPHWTTDPNVRGFGVGEKETDGEPTGVEAVRVFVSAKVARDLVTRPVPRTIPVPGTRRRVPTDVHDLRVAAAAPAGAPRPAAPGASISDPSGAPGTLGYVVKRHGSPDSARFILSAYHVLAAGGGGPGTPIVQPAGGSLADAHIADFFDGDPPVTSGGFDNLIDAAIAELLDPNDVTDVIPGIGKPIGFSMLLNVGMPVHIVGATTSGFVGRIIEPSYAFRFDTTLPDGTRASVGYADVVLCEAYAARGDSGSVVLNEADEIVGVHFWGNNQTSVFCKIEHVIDRLDIRMP